jgi:NTP pyrophosphatase (non-canonical NTP hydrolase)
MTDTTSGEGLSGIDRQNREFAALTELSKRWGSLQRVAVVDDDYPEVRHNYEGALKDFVRAIGENGRLAAVSPLTFVRFSAANRDRCQSPLGFNHPLSGWSSSDWMTAMVGEVGEAANIVKKLNRVRDGIPGNKMSDGDLYNLLRKELGDVFVYLDLMCQALGFSIADAAVEVFNTKSAEIGYGTKL